MQAFLWDSSGLSTSTHHHGETPGAHRTSATQAPQDGISRVHPAVQDSCMSRGAFVCQCLTVDLGSEIPWEEMDSKGTGQKWKQSYRDINNTARGLSFWRLYSMPSPVLGIGHLFVSQLLRHLPDMSLIQVRKEEFTLVYTQASVT